MLAQTVQPAGIERHDPSSRQSCPGPQNREEPNAHHNAGPRPKRRCPISPAEKKAVRVTSHGVILEVTSPELPANAWGRAAGLRPIFRTWFDRNRQGWGRTKRQTPGHERRSPLSSPARKPLAIKKQPEQPNRGVGSRKPVVRAAYSPSETSKSTKLAVIWFSCAIVPLRGECVPRFSANSIGEQARWSEGDSCRFNHRAA